jgi:predicted nucleic acid-binding protein
MVFVDTGGWITIAVKRDRYHKKAATYYRKLSRDTVRLVTSNSVLAETYTRIRFDDGHAKALQFNASIQEAIQVGRLNLQWVTPAIHLKAWDIFENYADQDFCFLDCTSFAIVKHVGVKKAFGFDDHFKTMGLILKPAKNK